jgi:hypothetical protein
MLTEHKLAFRFNYFLLILNKLDAAFQQFWQLQGETDHTLY